MEVISLDAVDQPDDASEDAEGDPPERGSQLRAPAPRPSDTEGPATYQAPTGVY